MLRLRSGTRRARLAPSTADRPSPDGMPHSAGRTLVRLPPTRESGLDPFPYRPRYSSDRAVRCMSQPEGGVHVCSVNQERAGAAGPSIGTQYDAST